LEASLGYIARLCFKKRKTLLRRQISGRSQFEASLGKQFTKPYLKKKKKNLYTKKGAGRVAQDAGPELKPQYHTQTTTKRK
jgi:hypothetical protein